MYGALKRPEKAFKSVPSVVTDLQFSQFEFQNMS